jgi:hypothetical protein
VADAAGSAASLTAQAADRRPVHVQTDELDGHTAIRFSRSAAAGVGTGIYSATGGIVGLVDHEISLVGKWTANDTDGAGADQIMAFGADGGAYTSSLGRFYTPGNSATLRAWGGGSGGAGARGDVADTDLDVHLYEKVCNAATGRLIVMRNGRPDFDLTASNGVAWASKSCLVASGLAAAFGLVGAPYGYRRIVAGYPIPNADVFTGIFWNKVRTHVNRSRFHRWLASEYPSRFSHAPTLLTVGDSRAWGYPYSTIGDARYSKVVADALGYRDGNSGVGSTTIATALANIDVSLLCGSDGMSGAVARLGTPAMIIVDSADNDLYASRSAADCFADELAIFAAARAAYPGIVCVSVFPLPDTALSGPQDTERLALAALRAGGSNTADYYVPFTGAAASLQTVNGTDYIDSAHLNAVGHAKAAAEILAVLP